MGASAEKPKVTGHEASRRRGEQLARAWAKCRKVGKKTRRQFVLEQAAKYGISESRIRAVLRQYYPEEVAAPRGRSVAQSLRAGAQLPEEL